MRTKKIKQKYLVSATQKILLRCHCLKRQVTQCANIKPCRNGDNFQFQIANRRLSIVFVSHRVCMRNFAIDCIRDHEQIAYQMCNRNQ